MSPKRQVLAPADKASRIAHRHEVGKLRDNRIAASTLQRYTKAVQSFENWRLTIQLPEAETYEQLDLQIGWFLERCWEDGESRALAADVISGTQHF